MILNIFDGAIDVVTNITSFFANIKILFQDFFGSFPSSIKGIIIPTIFICVAIFIYKLVR